MKRTGKRWIVIGFILLSLLLSAATAVATNSLTNTTESNTTHQIVQRLIDYFAEPARTTNMTDSQQESFAALQPMTDCWLITNGQTMPNQTQNNEGVQNEKY